MPDTRRGTLAAAGRGDPLRYNAVMNRSTRRARLLVLTAALAASAPTGPAAVRAQSDVPYVQQIEAWRARREAALRRDDGWLTVVGLSWLKPGNNRVGSDPGADVVLPSASVPRAVGTIHFDGTRALFRPDVGVDVKVNGQPATEQVLRPQPGQYDVLTTGTVTAFVIRRGDRFGIRVRDTHSEARRAFTGTPWFPIQESYRIKARFQPHAKPTSLMVPNVLGDLDPWPSPGSVTFTLNGTACTLQAVYEGADSRELFFIFRDGTTGHETYPAGRFLYADAPRDGEVVLDFNKAHSPPCAFTPYATCPVPPRENALPVRIEAGERYARH